MLRLYVRNQDDFNQIMENKNTIYDLSKIAKHLEIKHSISNVAQRIKKLQPFNIINSQVNEPLICFASHDFKFIDGYISQLKSNGRRVIRDKWEWGQVINLQKQRIIITMLILFFVSGDLLMQFGFLGIILKINHFISAFMHKKYENARKNSVSKLTLTK